MVQQMTDEQVREMVRERYAASATGVLSAQAEGSCCGTACCGSTADATETLRALADKLESEG